MAHAPLRFIAVGAVLGDSESFESLALPSVYSSGGSRNTWLDRYGRASSILGYSRRTTTPVVSQTGKPVRLRALYHYVTPAPSGDPSLTTRTEMAIFDTGTGGPDFELHFSTNGGQTWTRQLNLGSTALNHIPDFAQLGTLLTIAFGINQAVYQYDGTTLSIASTPRQSAPAAAAAGAGNLTGTYYWRVQPVKSDGTVKAASPSSPVLSLNAQNATITWTADTDVNVTGYNILRTAANGATYFFDGYALGRTATSFTSTQGDMLLIQNAVADFYGDAPPTGMCFVEPHKERMWYGDQNRRWYYSDAGRPVSINLGASYFDMTDAATSSDRNRGGTGNFRGMFVAWFERSIWTVSGTGQMSGMVIDFQRRRTSAQIGTVHHKTVARIPKGAIYIDALGRSVETSGVTLAYLTPLGDVRLFDGENDTIISFLKARTFLRLTYGSREKSFAVMDVARNEVTWVFPVDGQAEPSIGVTWNYQYGTMTERSWPFACAIPSEESNDSSVLLAGSADLSVGGVCYLLWDGLTFDGAPIDAIAMTKTFYGEAPVMNDDGGGNAPLTYAQKRWRWVEALVKADSAMDLLVEWFPTEADDDSAAYGSDIVHVALGVLVSANGDPILSSDGDQIVLGKDTLLWRSRVREGNPGAPTRMHYGHSRGMRLRFSSLTPTASWSLVGFSVAYQVLPGLKREFRH